MEIDYDTFMKMNNMEIIDLREEYKYKINHLNNSLNINFQSLIVYPEKYLRKDKKYLLVCDYGLTSKNTSEILNRNGYHTYSLKGGIKKIL